MKNNNTNLHPELSGKTGSIANALSSNKDKINSMAGDKTFTVAAFKAFLLDLINGITNKTDKSPATKRFIDSLNNQKSKDGILLLVYNTILAGDNLAIVRERH